jgi:hypothetical protein
MSTPLGMTSDLSTDAAGSGVEPEILPRLPDPNQLELFGTAMRRSADNPATSQPGDNPVEDDVRRLEASLRWLREEWDERRLPPAATLAKVPGLRAPAIEVHHNPPSTLRRGPSDHFALASRLAAPPVVRFASSEIRRARILRGVTKLALGSVVVALAAYYLWTTMISPPAVDLVSVPKPVRTVAYSPPPIAPQGLAQRSEAPAAPKDAQLAVAPASAEGIGAAPDAAVPAAKEATKVVALAATPREQATPTPIEANAGVAAKTAEPTPAPAAPDASSVAQPAAPAPPGLSPRDVALLVERGRVYFEAGDVAAARLLFRRAANAGDAAAALAMGATYDPAVLSNRLVRGFGADLEQARIWYEKARELGSPEGPRRLEMLAHRE